MSINRRNLFKLGTAAGLLPRAPSSQPGREEPHRRRDRTAAEAASGIKTLKGGVTMVRAAPGHLRARPLEDLEPGKSVLNDGVVMNASHWGIGRPREGRAHQRIEPFEKDHAPSMQLQGDLRSSPTTAPASAIRWCVRAT